MRDCEDGQEIILRFSKLHYLVVLSLGLAVVLAACGSSGEPAIQLGSEQVDLGAMSNGTIEEFSVEVRNLGNAPLVIEAVTTSCGCTSASVTPQTIEPGEVGELMVVYDSGAHGPEFAGEVQRQVFIASNDPDLREVVLNLQATVTLPEALLP